MYQTNPISQRIEQLGDKWTDASYQPKVRVIRILAKDDEVKMCDTFFSYIFALESNVSDMPVHFHSIFNEETFSEDLLYELSEVVKIWNETPKKGDMPFEEIKWEADYTLSEKKNAAALFVANLNNFAQATVADKGIFVTAILDFNSSEKKAINKWLSEAIKYGISEDVRLALLDTEDDAFFKRIAEEYPDEVYTLEPDMDMPTALVQLASMGDPDDPAVVYRQSFIKMMTAIGKRQEKDTKKHADECLQIALDNIHVNPYWIGQEVAVYTALTNDAIGYKKWNVASEYAGKAVQASLKSKDTLEKGVAERMMGQAYLLKGTMDLVDKKYHKARESFESSSSHFESCNDNILQVEALRMSAVACKKEGESDDELKTLVKGFKVGEKLSPELVLATSFPLLVKRLLKKDYEGELSDDELNAFFVPKLGDEWRDTIKAYGTADFAKHQNNVRTTEN